MRSKQKSISYNYSINLANFWLFGWTAIGIFVCSSDLVSLFFGEGYVLPIRIPFIISINFYMVGMQNAVWTYKNTMGIFRQGRYLLFLTAAINLALSILLGHQWGLFGILFATTISCACTNTWYDPYAIHKYGFERSVFPYYLRYLVYALIFIFTGGSCYYLCTFLHFSLVTNVILKIVICSVIPNAVFLSVFSGCRHSSIFGPLFNGISAVFCTFLGGRGDVSLLGRALPASGIGQEFPAT